MKVKDLIEELNLDKVDQLLTNKVKGGWLSISWNESYFFTFTNGDNSSFTILPTGWSYY